MLLSSFIKKTLHSSKIFISYISYELTSIINYYTIFVVTLLILSLLLSTFC